MLFLPERVADQGLGRLLRDVALHAKVAPRRDLRQHLALAVEVVRGADRHGERELGLAARVAIQALVEVLVDLVAVDAVWNDRRLLRVVARHPVVVVHGVGQPRRLRGLQDRRRSAHRVDQRLGPGRCRGQRQQGEDGSHALVILTAHFLKSVWKEIGSVASSVTLLMSWLASNQGTNTRPRGGLLRPRVSTRVRMLPRLELISTSTPRLTPSALASSGCM